MKIKIGESWGSRVDRDLDRVRRLRELAGPAHRVDGRRERRIPRRAGTTRRRGAGRTRRRVVRGAGVERRPGGLRLLRAALRCDIAAGEYAADEFETAALLDAVDCLQLDATRCGGYTGWLRCAALAAARNLDVSAHCAPALHAPVAASIPNLRHIEWFADHVRIEAELFCGAPPARDGALHLRGDTVGHGLSLSPQSSTWRTG